jgi:rhodanese-related sulfurtransferase
MLGDFAGGVIIIVVGAIIGIAQNSVRSNPIKLIQDTRPVSTANHGGQADADTGSGSVTGNPAGGQEGGAGELADALPEGAISVEETRRLYDEGVAVFIDARSPEGYAEGHIPGAINIPYDRLPQYLETLQSQVLRTDRIVCYCWSPTCDFSDQLATELQIMGYENIDVFTGGWEEWTAGDNPTETGGEDE